MFHISHNFAALTRGGDGFLQHLLIKLDADLADMAGLFLAQQVACAANIEVMAGKLEAGAEGIELLDGVQTLLCGFGQFLVLRERQVSISTLFGAANTSAQLVKLCQAEHFRLVDDHCVGVRNIKAGFHNGGGEQDIEGTVIECRHLILDIFCAHLPVRCDDLQFRHKVFQFLFQFFHIGNARADIE